VACLTGGVVAGELPGRWLIVRSVAGQAGERVGALVAAACVHLLDVPGDRHPGVGRIRQVGVDEVLQRQPRPEVRELSPACRDHRGRAQVALLTDRFAKFTRQVGGLDDAVINTATPRVGFLLVAFDMQRTGAMTALTRDCRLNHFHSVHALVNGFRLPGVAKETIRPDPALESRLLRVVVTR
jgi:hypothetical protein